MDEAIKQIERAMNDYIVETDAENSLIYDNLGLFYDLSIIIKDVLSYYIDDTNSSIDYSKITKMPLFDKLNLIDKFYKEHNINFDLNKYINDGTIDFVYYDFFNDNKDSENKKVYHFGHGSNTYEKLKKLVNVTNTGLITDILVLVHELSHFRNQPDNGRNQINALLTEVLSYAEELICVDYLSSLGYEEDMKIWKKTVYYIFYQIARAIRPIYKMFLLYEELGNISESSYEIYYGSKEEYVAIIKYMTQFVGNKNFELYYKSRYIIGALLGTHLYNEYKKDPSFMKNIILLHSKINNSNAEECFQLIGLTNLADEDKEKLRNSLKTVTNELKQNYTQKSR